MATSREIKITFADDSEETKERRGFLQIAKKNGVKILSRLGHNFHSKIIRQIQKTSESWGKYALQNVN